PWERSHLSPIRGLPVIRPLRRLTALLAATLTAAALSTTSAQADEGPEQIVNGTFDNSTASWWCTPNIELGVEDGRLCVNVPGGTTNPWDVIIGQNDIPLVAGETYAFSFFGIATPSRTIRTLVQLPVDPWTQFFVANPQISASGDNY